MAITWGAPRKSAKQNTKHLGFVTSTSGGCSRPHFFELQPQPGRSLSTAGLRVYPVVMLHRAVSAICVWRQSWQQMKAKDLWKMDVLRSSQISNGPVFCRAFHPNQCSFTIVSKRLSHILIHPNPNRILKTRFQPILRGARLPSLKILTNDDKWSLTNSLS